MKRSLERLVWKRARDRCEYCLLPQAFSTALFEIDHVIPQQHGGRTTARNLALSCFYCNKYKGPNLSGLDPRTGRLTPLFHPRRQEWSRHFRWRGARLVGRTATGRVTILVLHINDPVAVLARQALIDEKVFFPELG